MLRYQLVILVSLLAFATMVQKKLDFFLEKEETLGLYCSSESLIEQGDQTQMMTFRLQTLPWYLYIEINAVAISSERDSG